MVDYRRLVDSGPNILPKRMSEGKNKSIPGPTIQSLQKNYQHEEAAICIGETSYIREVAIRCLDSTLLVQISPFWFNINICSDIFRS